jgi:uncharacterized protein
LQGRVGRRWRAESSISRYEQVTHVDRTAAANISCVQSRKVPARTPIAVADCTIALADCTDARARPLSSHGYAPQQHRLEPRHGGGTPVSVLGIVATLAMAVAIFLIPLGWPGIWLMVGIVGVGAVLGEVGWGVLVLVALVAGAAEAVEFLIVYQLGSRYGGSSRAFWGAVIGGTVGVFVGFPVPVLGPVIAGFIGSFIGAAIATLQEGGGIADAGRVGWGVVLGRVISTGVKVAAAIVVLALGGSAWLF